MPDPYVQMVAFEGEENRDVCESSLCFVMKFNAQN